MSECFAAATATDCHATLTLDPAECSLAELPVGQSGTVVAMSPGLRGRKKFADVGIVPGTLLQMEVFSMNFSRSWKPRKTRRRKASPLIPCTWRPSV